MSRFIATPASEELARFLEGLAPGAHVAVDLGGLSMDVAVDLSREIASRRKERFLVVAHGASEGPELVADSLVNALPLEKFAAPHNKAWVVVDAASSVQAQGARAHAGAEAHLGIHIATRLTVVCFYTHDALAQVRTEQVHRLHTMVAVPGQMGPGIRSS